MNAQLHTSLKTTPFEVVFRQKKPINWLTAQERREAKGVETEDGEVITEESLSKELDEEMDEEVIAGFREISEFLTFGSLLLEVPLQQKRLRPGLQSSQNSLFHHQRSCQPHHELLEWYLSRQPLLYRSLNLQRNRLHHHHHHLLYVHVHVHLYLLNKTSLRWSQLNQSHLQPH
jgi:hypothetical protein